ncbi:Mur ligase family protein [Puniceicoccaceae bacterium K14]|nr:Mur ligase family protein [Puniceicoccaceae bacterium K14]
MRIYFLGIAGTAMGNLALLLRDQGHEVMGADLAVYPPMSNLLVDAGIRIMEGYSVDRLRELTPDLVVVGNAFSRGNEEVEFLLESRVIEFCSLPEALSRFALSGRKNVVVTGTHGKTTTTAITAYLLEQSGIEPGYMIGGAPLDPEKGWSNGRAESPFVIEGDEYDSAFFDKRSKFIHYQPHVVIVNNLEFDHADIFRDLQDVKRTFAHLLRIVPRNGFVLANGDDENVMSLLPLGWTTVYTVGTGENCDLRIGDYRTESDGSSFELFWKGKLWLSVSWKMTGLFNARNAAMACLASALALAGGNDPSSVSLTGLELFRGVKRRQQVRANNRGITVIEDFAHHPTAIEEMLVALRSRHPRARLIAAFEPRSNTSRLEIMKSRMVAALSKADEVLIGAAKKSSVADVTIIDTAAMAKSLQEQGTPALACEKNEDAQESLESRLGELLDSETILVFLTNGSFGGAIEKVADFVTGSQKWDKVFE